MCLAQGPQRSDAGEAQTGGLSVFEPLRSLYDIHVWYLQYWALYDDLAILFLSLFTGSIQVQSLGSFEIYTREYIYWQHVRRVMALTSMCLDPHLN